MKLADRLLARVPRIGHGAAHSGAEEAEKLFDTARARIENHFEIRQALRIPEE
jgi:hypothetical protein